MCSPTSIIALKAVLFRHVNALKQNYLPYIDEEAGFTLRKKFHDFCDLRHALRMTCPTNPREIRSVLEDLEEILARQHHIQLEMLLSSIDFNEQLIDGCRREIQSQFTKNHFLDSTRDCGCNKK